jgi:hypothetical protein
MLALADRSDESLKALDFILQAWEEGTEAASPPS